MSATPAVTVVVPFLNAERTIGDLLRGLASQQPTTTGEAEFVFVDNGSHDAGPQLVRDAALPSSRIVTESTPGVSAARNRGLAAARGDVIAVIDSDCVPSRRWLRELVAPFDRPAVHLAAGAGASYPPKTAAQRFVARYGMNDNRRTLETVLPYANGRNMAVRRSSAEAVAGWPVELLRGDDIEFSTRILTRFGGTIEYREHAVAFHQDRATDDELWDQARGYGRGAAEIYARHPDRLPFGAREQLTRMRIAGRRRLRMRLLELGSIVGFSNAEDVEFARYVVRWDQSWWLGFQEERSRLKNQSAG